MGGYFVCCPAFIIVFFYLLPFRSSSENMILLRKKDILISEHDQGSAVGFVSTPSPCLMPFWFMPFFL
jgi:hypothetical protein